MKDDFYIAVNGLVLIMAPNKNTLVLQIPKPRPKFCNKQSPKL